MYLLRRHKSSELFPHYQSINHALQQYHHHHHRQHSYAATSHSLIGGLLLWLSTLLLFILLLGLFKVSITFKHNFIYYLLYRFIFLVIHWPLLPSSCPDTMGKIPRFSRRTLWSLHVSCIFSQVKEYHSQTPTTESKSEVRISHTISMLLLIYPTRGVLHQSSSDVYYISNTHSRLFYPCFKDSLYAFSIDNQRSPRIGSQSAISQIRQLLEQITLRKETI